MWVLMWCHVRITAEVTSALNRGQMEEKNVRKEVFALVELILNEDITTKANKQSG